MHNFSDLPGQGITEAETAPTLLHFLHDKYVKKYGNITAVSTFVDESIKILAANPPTDVTYTGGFMCVKLKDGARVTLGPLLDLDDMQDSLSVPVTGGS